MQYAPTISVMFLRVCFPRRNSYRDLQGGFAGNKGGKAVHFEQDFDIAEADIVEHGDLFVLGERDEDVFKGFFFACDLAARVAIALFEGFVVASDRFLKVGRVRFDFFAQEQQSPGKKAIKDRAQECVSLIDRQKLKGVVHHHDAAVGKRDLVGVLAMKLDLVVGCEGCEFFAGFVDHGLCVIDAYKDRRGAEEAAKEFQKSARRATDVDDACVWLVVLFGPMCGAGNDFVVHRDRTRDHVIKDAHNFFVEGEGFGPRAAFEEFVFFGVKVELGGCFGIHRRSPSFGTLRIGVTRLSIKSRYMVSAEIHCAG